MKAMEVFGWLEIGDRRGLSCVNRVSALSSASIGSLISNDGDGYENVENNSFIIIASSLHSLLLTQRNAIGLMEALLQ